MYKVTFQKDNITCTAEDDTWLYDVCEEAGASVPFACKAGACGTCATEVLEGDNALGPRKAREIRTLEASGLDPQKYRLLCLADVHGDLVIGESARAATEQTTLQLIDARVEEYRPLTQTVCEQRFALESGQLNFQPGQYMIFHVPGFEQVIRRSYSISSTASDRDHFEVCVRAVSGGYCSNYVHRLRPGDRIQVEGPYGDFHLAEPSDRDVLMVATGTGISPIKSMLLELLSRSASKRIRLFFGLRNVSDLFYMELIEELAHQYPHFEPIVTLSQPDRHRWPGCCGRVTDLIRERITPAEAARTEAYLCGGKPMIEDVKRLLMDMGTANGHIFHENFF